jgi:hypothetical protein
VGVDLKKPSICPWVASRAAEDCAAQLASLPPVLLPLLGTLRLSTCAPLPTPATLEATQGQILRQSPIDATSRRVGSYGRGVSYERGTPVTLSLSMWAHQFGGHRLVPARILTGCDRISSMSTYGCLTTWEDYVKGGVTKRCVVGRGLLFFIALRPRLERYKII